MKGRCQISLILAAVRCRLPSPMSNPGLTPEWAKIILDSHQKRFVDECPICLNDLCHNFQASDLSASHPLPGGAVADDVASCGTVEYEDEGVLPLLSRSHLLANLLLYLSQALRGECINSP